MPRAQGSESRVYQAWGKGGQTTTSRIHTGTGFQHRFRPTYLEESTGDKLHDRESRAEGDRYSP